MKQLLNTLYITLPDVYLGCDGENVIVLQDQERIARFPLHNFQAINCFNYAGASPSLMYKCSEKNIDLCFFNPNGKFLARSVGRVRGNVLLRKEQYRISDNKQQSIHYANNMIVGKIYNSKWVVERIRRDHNMRVDVEKIAQASKKLSTFMKEVRSNDSHQRLLGLEGASAEAYFGVFNELILNQKEDFVFENRSRRPPLDLVNSLLSYFYTVLTYEMASALEGVGLDPYVGFYHVDRSGRISLALDMVEELRAVIVDRFVLSLINRRQVSKNDFMIRENGTVEIKDDSKKELLRLWQLRKAEKIKHPFLQENVEWGLVPHIQAMLLARTIRGDLSEYPPFLWK